MAGGDHGFGDARPSGAELGVLTKVDVEERGVNGVNGVLE